MADAIDADRDLQVFFFSPYLTTDEKKDGLRKAISDAEPIVQNFLELLIENHRMPALFRIRREFDRLWEDENQLLPVQITSAVELSDETKRQIVDRIAEQTGLMVMIWGTVRPTLLPYLVLLHGDDGL